ncbi:hypothetical protein [Desulfoplanes sp.]
MSHLGASIGTSLMQSALSGGAADIAGDVAELALDAALNEGLLKDLPVFGWFFKAYGMVGSIRERILLGKIAKFLQATAAVSDSDRTKFREKFAADPEFCRKIGENLMLLLDRHDNMDKAHILGKVFSAYLRGIIDYESFLKIASAVDRALISDLKRLEEYYRKIQSYEPKMGKAFAEVLDDETSQSLYIAGLVRSEGVTEDIYLQNKTGEQLIQFMYE